MKITLSIAVYFVMLSSAFCQDKPEPCNLQPKAFQTALQQMPEAVVLDVRTADEVRKGTIKDATYIDFFGREFESKIKQLDKDKAYFVYCAGGGRSSETVELMSRLGFKSICNLEGGFNAWKKEKLPVSSSKN